MDKEIKTKVISVFGTSGSGKSYIANKYFHEKGNIYKYLLDLDVQNSASSIMNDAKKEDNIMNYIANKTSISNKIISSNIQIDEYEIKYKLELDNLIGNNKGTIIIDLPNCIFLKEVYDSIKISDEIFFIINPNFLSIRQSIKYLEVLNTVWNIKEEKIKIVVNKVTINSLSKNVIKEIYKKYQVIDYIKYNKNIEKMINLQEFKYKGRNVKKNLFKSRK